ncbi:GspE/PulE family protein [Patescibacteria group bacterium]
MAQLNKIQQQEKIAEMRKKEEEDLVRALSERHNLPYIDLSTTSINTDALRLIPEGQAREAAAAAFSLTGKNVLIAIISPQKDSIRVIQDDLTRQGYKPVFYMASKQSVNRALDLYKEVSYAEETEAGVFDISQAEVETFMNQVGGLTDLEKLLGEITTTQAKRKISRILEVILAGAIATDASDIHIEPEKIVTRLRFRLDGVLHDLIDIDHSIYNFLLSRIKLLSGLKLNIRKSAQDGRFSIKLGAVDIEVRTSVIPGEYGESIVLRILNPETIQITLKDLGIEEGLFEELSRQLKKPNGMILTTGPTGSGKTTTLYAFLRFIYNPEIKVITIENPIEYHLDGITQTQVEKSADYTFLTGLRSALRQDPDIIMVGEIRDEETARVAINSALTGHLVFSTLHTNNAAGVIPRLVDLGVNPKIISSALNISLAQRLVRKLCPDCKESYSPNEEERALLTNILASIKEKRNVSPEISELWGIPGEGNSCTKCGGVGYKGRIGVFEGILTDKHVEKVIQDENVSELAVVEASKQQKMLDMAEDGVLKVLNGVTSLEELQRVVDIRREESIV